MTRDEFKRRFNATGTIGNMSDLVPVPRVEPVKSYHMINSDTGEEMAIRYDIESLARAALNARGSLTTLIKPIFKQFPPEWSN